MTANTLTLPALRAGPESSQLSVKKILVPVDFSGASKKAFRYALQLAEDFQSELTVLYVLAPAPSANFSGDPDDRPFSDHDLSGADNDLRALVASAQRRGIERARARIRIGVPSHEIVELAKEADADLIVIATHGYTGWKHFCIGSTAERVVRAAPCPVFVVREKEHDLVR